MGSAARVVLAAVAEERKRPASGGNPDAGDREVQLRLATELTFDEYRTQRGWETATLSACPVCESGGCGFHRLGTYMRKVPAVAYVARYWCPEQHISFGLLPDFFASRMPGTLDMIEQAAAKAETAPMEKAADELRPADATDAVTLGAAVVWVRLRVVLARAILTTVKGLMPERFEDVPPRVSAFRRRLGTLRVLVALRGICERYLHRMSAPLGLVPRPEAGSRVRSGRAQPPGPDPPAPAR
ncbi:MAG TPA: hypothetical protein VEJ23_02345 [Solirubrobacteraceae bacterium]|nr:hypothetical protein [Solirubrobacteraceae bacterium]